MRTMLTTTSSLKSSSVLQNVLMDYTATEHIEGYKCSRCHKQTCASKRLTIYQWPRVLTCHFKRFRKDFSGEGTTTKMRLSKAKSAAYKLHAVHLESMYIIVGLHVVDSTISKGGHYCLKRCV